MAKSFATADLVDAHSDVVRSCETQFRQFGGRSQFHGAIRTIKVFENNALIRKILSTPGAGAVLVIDAGASPRCAVVGGNIAKLAEHNGWAGWVVWGLGGDKPEVVAGDIGIKALGTNPWRRGKSESGQVDLPVSFGGV